MAPLVTLPKKCEKNLEEFHWWGQKLMFLSTSQYAVVKTEINLTKFELVRKASDLLTYNKCLVSPHDGATIAREVYFRVVLSHRLSLSKFQPNRARSFVSTACRTGYLIR